MAKPHVPTLKLLLLGDSGVGKSSLMVRFSDQKFMPNMISTAGIDFKAKKITIKEQEVNLQIWDTAGQERFKTITQAYYRGAMGIVLIYDVTDRKSLINIKYWMDNIAQHANKSVRKLLVGNKTDLVDLRQVQEAEGKQLADEFGVPFLESSAKDNTGVAEMFDRMAADVLEHLGEFNFQPLRPGLPVNKPTENEESSSCGCKSH